MRERKQAREPTRELIDSTLFFWEKRLFLEKQSRKDLVTLSTYLYLFWIEGIMNPGKDHALSKLKLITVYTWLIIPEY